MAYFVRPKLGSGLNLSGNNEYLAAHSLVIFGWYVPAILLVLFPFGFAIFLFRKDFVLNNLFLCLGMTLFVGYLINPSIAPDHFWATRRWVLFSIPFAIIVSFKGLQAIRTKYTFINRIIKICIISVAFYQILTKSILFYDIKMLSGYLAGYMDACELLPKEKVIYFTKEQRIASPLNYIFDRKTYLISDLDMFLEKAGQIESSGYQVFFISQDPYPITKYSENLKFHSYLSLKGLYPIETIETYPDVLYSKSHNLYVYQYGRNGMGPDTLPPKKLSWAPSQSGAYTRQGAFTKDGSLVAGKKSGYLMYGPYISLAEGSYRLRILGKNLNHAKFDITSEDGTNQISPWKNASEGSEYSSNFRISKGTGRKVEFRILVEKNSQTTVHMIELYKL